MNNQDGAVMDVLDEADTVEVRLPPEKPRNIMDQAFWSLGLPVYVQEQTANWQLEIERHIGRCDGCDWCEG
jgi:hypothetical protein